MTIEKAMAVLKDLRNFMKDLRIFVDDYAEDCEALDVAIKALENLHLIKVNAYAIQKFLNEVETGKDE